VLLRFPFVTNKRISLKSYFESINLELGLWFTAPLSSKSINHSLFGYEWGCCPQAEKVSKTIVNLPMSLSFNEAKKRKLNEIINNLLL
jgi:dTDP-4-amino-4,6-dideoxygalactose transaminase